MDLCLQGVETEHTVTPALNMYIFGSFDGLKPVTVDIGVLGHDAVSFGRLLSTFRENLLLPLFKPINSSRALAQYSHLLHTRKRVGTLIVATIYLQLIQNSYMFRSFTVLQCSHQHCVQPVASDVEVVGYL